MKKNLLICFSISAISIASNVSYAAIPNVVTVYITNNTSCPLISDPNSSNCSAPINVKSGESQTFFCTPSQHFELYYNPDKNWNHASTLFFNHYVTKTYSYSMNSEGFSTPTFDGTQVQYTLSPTIGYSYTLTGANSVMLSDDKALTGAKDLLQDETRYIDFTVTAPADTCNTQ